MNIHIKTKEYKMFISPIMVLPFLIVWLLVGLTAIAESESRCLSDVLLLSFGGIQPDGQLHTIGLLRWIGSTLTGLTAVLIGFKRGRANMAYTLSRLRTAGIWWRYKISAAILCISMYFMLGIIVVCMMSLLLGVSWDTFPFSILLYPLMLVFCTMVLCAASLFFTQTITLALFISIWGITAVLGDKALSFSLAFCGCYGMAQQVTKPLQQIVVVVIQVGIIICFWVSGGQLVKLSQNSTYVYE